jgi:hypothetical protein
VSERRAKSRLSPARPWCGHCVLTTFDGQAPLPVGVITAFSNRPLAAESVVGEIESQIAQSHVGGWGECKKEHP